MKSGPSSFRCPAKAPGSFCDRSRPGGGGGAEDFRKVAGGDVAGGCNLIIKRVGALAGPGRR